MQLKQNIEKVTLYLTQRLSGYEVIPANWAWHIHKGEIYCGLQYQTAKKWQGKALHYLPRDVIEQLKKLTR